MFLLAAVYGANIVKDQNTSDGHCSLIKKVSKQKLINYLEDTGMWPYPHFKMLLNESERKNPICKRGGGEIQKFMALAG